MIEVYRPILGYEDRYEISNFGKVRSLKRRMRDGSNRRVIKPFITPWGYYRIALCGGNGRRKKFFIHFLVAITFIPNPNNFSQINHINNIKTNNRADNLEWCTPRHNVHHLWSQRKKSSKFMGVTWDKNRSKWCSQINIGKEHVYLGRYDYEHDAYSAYKKAIDNLKDGGGICVPSV